MAPLDLMSAGSVQSIVKEVAYGEARADVRRMSTVTPQSSLNVTSMMSNTSGTAAATPQTKNTSQTSGSSTRRGGGGRARGRGRGRGVDAQGSTLSATQSLNRSGLDTTSMDSTMGGSLASQRQLGPTRPAIDPYGMYHLPHERDSGRLAYGSRPAGARAAKESEIPNFKGSYLGRFPLVSADLWTSDHLSERSRSVDAFFGKRARGTLMLKRS